MSDERLRELERRRDVIRGIIHDTQELRSRLSDERAQLEEAQLAGDRSIETVWQIRAIGGEQVNAQRQQLDMSRQLDEVNELIARSTT